MKDRLLTTDEIKKYHWIYISPASIETTIAILQEQDKKSVAANNAKWREKIERGERIFYCTEKEKCKWQGFALNHGLSWGTSKNTTTQWQEWHTKECKGKLIECAIVDLSEMEAKQ